MIIKNKIRSKATLNATWSEKKENFFSKYLPFMFNRRK